MRELSRLELNAIIERLIESSGTDQEARNAVAAFAASLRPMKRINLDATITRRGDHTSGATSEHGNIEIPTDQTEQQFLRLGQGTTERIGYYKLSRATVQPFLFFPKEERILIHHYWKADQSTTSDSEKPEAWCIGCTSKMEPAWFGRFTYTSVSLGWLFLVVAQIQELWGPKPGRLHPFTIEVALKVD